MVVGCGCEVVAVVNQVGCGCEVGAVVTQPQVCPTFKRGPEPLEKEIHKILGSKREDRFSDPF